MPTAVRVQIRQRLHDNLPREAQSFLLAFSLLWDERKYGGDIDSSSRKYRNNARDSSGELLWQQAKTINHRIIYWKSHLGDWFSPFVHQVEVYGVFCNRFELINRIQALFQAQKYAASLCRERACDLLPFARLPQFYQPKTESVADLGPQCEAKKGCCDRRPITDLLPYE